MHPFFCPRSFKIVPFYHNLCLLCRRYLRNFRLCGPVLLFLSPPQRYSAQASNPQAPVLQYHIHCSVFPLCFCNRASMKYYARLCKHTLARDWVLPGELRSTHPGTRLLHIPLHPGGYSRCCARAYDIVFRILHPTSRDPFPNGQKAVRFMLLSSIIGAISFHLYTAVSDEKTTQDNKQF